MEKLYAPSLTHLFTTPVWCLREHAWTIKHTHLGEGWWRLSINYRRSENWCKPNFGFLLGMNVPRQGVWSNLLWKQRTRLTLQKTCHFLPLASPGEDTFPFDSRSHCVLLFLCITASEGNGNILTRLPQGLFKHQAPSPVQYCSS